MTRGIDPNQMIEFDRNVIDGQAVAQRVPAKSGTPLTGGAVRVITGVDELLLEDGTVTYQCQVCGRTDDTAHKVRGHLSRHSARRTAYAVQRDTTQALLDRLASLESLVASRDSTPNDNKDLPEVAEKVVEKPAEKVAEKVAPADDASPMGRRAAARIARERRLRDDPNGYLTELSDALDSLMRDAVPTLRTLGRILRDGAAPQVDAAELERLRADSATLAELRRKLK